ncbi:MAG: hypothetical protein FWD61_15250 [Phycisphaerales bacterium]|nr:hypothetical protein [Phycisphaerales bacterium]
MAMRDYLPLDLVIWQSGDLVICAVAYTEMLFDCQSHNHQITKPKIMEALRPV